MDLAFEVAGGTLPSRAAQPDGFALPESLGRRELWEGVLPFARQPAIPRDFEDPLFKLLRPLGEQKTLFRGIDKQRSFFVPGRPFLSPFPWESVTPHQNKKI